MSLLLWEYFWNEPDWIQAPPPASVSAADVVSLTIGGKPDRADSDFWEIRERYLARFVEPLLKETPNELISEVESFQNFSLDENKELLKLQEQRLQAFSLARRARTLDQLRTASQRVVQLSLDISKIQDQYYNQAVHILLLDLF